MLRSLFERAFGLCALCVAVVAFLAVPVGGKTSAQHVASILKTPPARAAASAFGDIARRLAGRAIVEAERLKDDAMAEHDRPRPAPR